MLYQLPTREMTGDICSDIPSKASPNRHTEREQPFHESVVVSDIKYKGGVFKCDWVEVSNHVHGICATETHIDHQPEEIVIVTVFNLV